MSRCKNSRGRSISTHTFKETKKRSDRLEIISNKNRRMTNKNNRNPLIQGRRLIKLIRPSPLSTPRRLITLFSTNVWLFNGTAMFISSLVTAVESGDVDLNDSRSMDFTPLRTVCLNENHNTSRCEHIKSITSISRIRKRHFDYCRNRQERRIEQLRQTKTYRRYHLNG